ncbi:MAG TPA: pectinesterase family protein, partial [Phycisphaerae bacterium]
MHPSLPLQIPLAAIILFAAESLATAAAPAPAAPSAPLTLLSRTPDQNAKDISPDTLLSLNFNHSPALGTSGQVRIYDAADDSLVDTLDLSVPLNQQSYTIATVQFHAYPVIVQGGAATIHPHNNLLKYGKHYYVQIDPGLLTDGPDPYPGITGKDAWTFSTRSAPPAPSDHYTVASAGTGDFATLQGAIDFLPIQNPKPVTLHIQNGTYNEIISLVSKSNIIFLGEDRAQTILTYANNEKVQLGASSSSRRGVVNVSRSQGIAFANLTIKNATPKGTGGGWQA